MWIDVTQMFNSDAHRWFTWFHMKNHIYISVGIRPTISTLTLQCATAYAVIDQFVQRVIHYLQNLCSLADENQYVVHMCYIYTGEMYSNWILRVVILCVFAMVALLIVLRVGYPLASTDESDDQLTADEMMFAIFGEPNSSSAKSNAYFNYVRSHISKPSPVKLRNIPPNSRIVSILHW